MSRVRTLGIAAVSAISLAACSSSNEPAPVATEPAPTTPAEPAPNTEPPAASPASELYALFQTDEGKSTRFDSCSGPIRILLNTGDLQEVVAEYTDVDVTAQIGELLTEIAAELSGATGFEIEYGGTTDIALSDELAETQVIVLNFGSTGFPGREDSLFEQKAIYGASVDTWQQIVSFQHFESSAGFYIHFEEAAKLADGSRDVGIDEAGKRWLRTILGEAFGLRQLSENDMVASNIPVEQHGDQLMYTDSHKEIDGVYNLTWGEGDKAGLALVGADNACF